MGHQKETAAIANDEDLKRRAKRLAKRFEKWLGKHQKKGSANDASSDEGEECDEEEEEGNEEEEQDSEEEECGNDDDSGTTSIEGRSDGSTAAEDDFVQSLINYRQKIRTTDDGKILEEMMRKEKKRVIKDRRQALWRLWYLEMGSQLLRVTEDWHYSKTGEPKHEKAERNKRHACRLINEIVGSLWFTFQERCLRLYDFFAGRTRLIPCRTLLTQTRGRHPLNQSFTA